LLEWGRERYSQARDWFVPTEYRSDVESYRRARLIIGFGILGSIFGAFYATFYLFIAHYWGTGIIVVCSATVASVPFILRGSKSLDLPAHILCLTLILGFFGLSLVEAGLHGHAIAWLVSVPLCAMILVGKKAAIGWMVASFAAAGILGGAAMSGVEIGTTYDPKWENIVSAAGYLGLIAFMFILGLIFESGRTRAFGKMQKALGELGAANERLVTLNNEKSEFLGIAAHDLKNPLTAIVANAELLTLPDTNPGEVFDVAKDIMAAAGQMKGLISDLLDANAIEEGRFTSDIQACDVEALIERSVSNNRLGAVKKGIRLHACCSDGLTAKADPKASLQIFDNLISNAIKFSPPNSTVSIRTFPEAGHVLIAVQDQGPGIGEGDQKKMFGKFIRLTARPTGGESSTGLGLSIVKRLVEAMSGSIDCQSVLGCGATFTVKLPVWIPNGPGSLPTAEALRLLAAETWATPTKRRPRN